MVKNLTIKFIKSLDRESSRIAKREGCLIYISPFF